MALKKKTSISQSMNILAEAGEHIARVEELMQRNWATEHELLKRHVEQSFGPDALTVKPKQADVPPGLQWLQAHACSQECYLKLRRVNARYMDRMRDVMQQMARRQAATETMLNKLFRDRGRQTDEIVTAIVPVVIKAVSVPLEDSVSSMAATTWEHVDTVAASVLETINQLRESLRRQGRRLRHAEQAVGIRSSLDCDGPNHAT